VRHWSLSAPHVLMTCWPGNMPCKKKKPRNTLACKGGHHDADLRGIKVAVVYFAAFNGFLAIILFLYRVLAARLHAHNSSMHVSLSVGLLCSSTGLFLGLF